MGAYEEALQALSRAPIADFLAERKRLAAELRARGDGAGAAEIAKRAKPVTSVWAVNQLYWKARDVFDEMLEAASRLRRGDRSAAKARHEAIANLRRRAGVLLKEAGHGSSEATLRRIATTLAAIAAAGGFEPDPPGALAVDRDPPGFDAAGLATLSIEKEHPVAPARRPSGGESAAREQAGRQAQLRAAEDRERKQREAERARRKAERARLQASLRTATADLRTKERMLASLEKELRDAERSVGDARALVNELERRLAELAEPD